MARKCRNKIDRWITVTVPNGNGFKIIGIRTLMRSLIGFLVGFGFLDFRAEASNCDLTQVPFCTWVYSTNGFFDVGDTGTIIDFQTLPNGSPSFGGANITPAFNYVLQGALFTSPFPSLMVVGNSQVGYGLEAYTSNILAHNWITAELTNPERGVGVWVIDHTTLFAYDAQGSLITSISHTDHNGIQYFLGIKSSVPIARVLIDRSTNEVTLDNFTMVHIPVPEPSSAALLLLAAPILYRHAGRRDRIW